MTSLLEDNPYVLCNLTVTDTLLEGVAALIWTKTTSDWAIGITRGAGASRQLAASNADALRLRSHTGPLLTEAFDPCLDTNTGLLLVRQVAE